MSDIDERMAALTWEQWEAILGDESDCTDTVLCLSGEEHGAILARLREKLDGLSEAAGAVLVFMGKMKGDELLACHGENNRLDAAMSELESCGFVDGDTMTDQGRAALRLDDGVSDD